MLQSTGVYRYNIVDNHTCLFDMSVAHFFIIYAMSGAKVDAFAVGLSLRLRCRVRTRSHG